MNKEYTQIEFSAGCTIDSAVNELLDYKRRNQSVWGSFNGIALYSERDTIDSAYKKIMGKTKSEHDQEMEDDRRKWAREEKKHEAAIPQLTTDWINRGMAILDEEYWKLWTEIVPIRLGDLYRGMELGFCLNIVGKLNENCALDEAKSIIEGQGHSGMSFGLICSMVKSFSKRGDEFVKHVR